MSGGLFPGFSSLPRQRFGLVLGVAAQGGRSPLLRRLGWKRGRKCLMMGLMVRGGAFA